ncbi:hypothetical protein ACFWUQ_13040 [Streptomyces sp. NPDC058662]|uniref:hypothetical protein n=1 Tax=Streptomyces sp. NPDC058662 TaxID=3346583 RepID=UPI00364CEDAE
MKRQFGALLGTLALAATALVGSATPAAAADNFTFLVGRSVPGVTAITVFNETEQEEAGSGQWWRDPAHGATGDTLAVYDDLADGYGLEAHLSTGRLASTRGQNSPSYDIVTGDLPEDRQYEMWVCVVKGTWSKCSPKVAVWS